MSIKPLKVIGTASKKEFFIVPEVEDLNLSIMDFLIKRGFTIASSCSGEGVCKKCVVNEDLLSCQMKIGDFLQQQNEIRISYL